MKNKKLKKSLKIAALASTIVFSFAASFSGVYAWFSIKNSEQNEIDSFNVQKDPNIVDLTYSLYKYDFDLKCGTLQDPTNDDYFTMNKYDNFIKERNLLNSSILKIKVDFASVFGSDSTRALKFDIYCQNSEKNSTFAIKGKDLDSDRKHIDDSGYKYTYNSKNYVCNNISNIISFDSFVYSYSSDTQSNVPLIEDTIDYTDSSHKLFDDALVVFNKQTDDKSFISSDLQSKSTSLSMTLTGIPGNASSVLVFLQYSYTESFVQNFLTNNEFIQNSTSSDAFQNGIDVSFAEDVTLIQVQSYKESN